MFFKYAAAAALAADVAVTSCGGSTTSSQAASSTSASASSSASSSGSESATASASASGAAPASSASASTSESIGGIRFYRPSTVVSQTGSSVTLKSPDTVTKVSNFYANLAGTGGWTVLSKSLTPYSGNLNIKKSGQGANIAVYPSGSGAMVTISTYPTG
jgi:hypothetical protein